VQVFGLVVAMTLRSPDNAEAAVEAGCLNTIVEVSQLLLLRWCCKLQLVQLHSVCCAQWQFVV
jgi:hypothetical protein